MPAGPGESHLTTLFADVHYYFSDPTSKPIHHRFARSSYLYLFYNASQHRAKLEIANHAGTADQDAFSGYLDITRLVYSHKQPNLFTLTIDATHPLPHDQWHLPGFDLGNEQKHLYRIHTVDIYTWTEKDAATLLGHLRATMAETAKDIRGAPAPQAQPVTHRDSISPVVQQLEQTAIGSNFPPRAESVTSMASQTSTHNHVPYNPAAPAAPEPIQYREKTPPPPDGGAGNGLSGGGRHDSAPQTQYATVPSSFGANSAQNTPRQAYFPGSPPQQQAQPHGRTPSMSFPGPPDASPPSTGYPGPPPRTDSFSANSQHASPPPPAQSPPSFAPPPTSPPPMGQPPFHRQSTSSSISEQPATQYANYAPSFAPPPIVSPGVPPPSSQFYSAQPQPPTPSAPPAYTTSFAAPPQSAPPATTVPQSHPAQQQVFAYSTYSYTQNQSYQGQHSYGADGAYTGDMHTQVYRPTEAEAKHGSHGGSSSKNSNKTPGPGITGRPKLEQRVDFMEKKVGGFLKKLDKML